MSRGISPARQALNDVRILDEVSNVNTDMFRADVHTQAKYAALYFHNILLPRVSYQKRYRVKNVLRETTSIIAMAAVNAGAPRRDVQSTETA